LDLVQDDISKLNSKMEPILDNVNIITKKAANISDETEKRFLDISHTIQNVTAVSKGFSAFWNKLNN